MPTRSSRNLMRLLVAAFLLLLGSDAKGHARVPVHKHHSSHPGIGAANHSAVLAATLVANPKDVDTALPQLLGSKGYLRDRRAQSEPAPTRNRVSLCSHERTTGKTARPPPHQV